MNTPPIIGITMGDGAGIGPEIIVKALTEPHVDLTCRAVVVGDRQRLVQAAEVCGLSPEVRAIEHPSQAHFRQGTVEVIDLGLLPYNLSFGVLSPVSGAAAFEYIRHATALALQGEIDAICTAPVNKEALHAAGHTYPGQTEILAELTAVSEVSMLLSSSRLKVLHVTTHLGLLDAIEQIDAGLILRTIRRGHEMLMSVGNPTPKIAVCGINPHAGENGLFGRGEEEEKIAPAVEQARAEGINAVGPLPADTVFFLASRGDFELVIAMYHDQGHGPVKALGIDAGVNVTVGLPVIRTSVDHGTAFDIAGTGAADESSLVQALLAAEALTRHRPAVSSNDGTS